MASKRPTVQSYSLGCHIVTGRHAWPLRIEKYLKGVGSSRQIDDKDGHARVRLICSRWSGVRSKAHGIRPAKLGAGGRVDDVDFHSLSIKSQRCRSTVNCNRSIGLHAPLEARLRSNLVLK